MDANPTVPLISGSNTSAILQERGPTCEQNLQFLKNQNAGLYLLLTNFRDKLPIENIQLLNHCFEPACAPLTICLNKITYYYVCRTCRQNPQYKICAECFDKDLHKNHSYFIQLGKGDCDCGIVGCENICKNHKASMIYDGQIVKPQPKFHLYVAFFLSFFDVLFGMSEEERKKSTPLLGEILTKLAALHGKNPLYIDITSYCFSLGLKNQDISILLTLLKTNMKENYLPETCCSLFKVLISSPPFQIQLLKTVFSINQIYSSVGSLRVLSKIVQKLLRSHVVLGEMSKMELLIFPNSVYSASQYYWDLVGNLMRNGSLHNYEHNLIAIVRLIYKKYKYQAFKLQRKGQLFQFLLSRISSDRKLIQSILREIIEKKSFFGINQKRSDVSWFNKIVRIVLYALNGEIDSFPLFFCSFNEKSLKNFVLYYFKEAFRTNNKCKFNGLTATCIFKIAQAYGFLNQLNQQLPVSQQISCQHFSNNLIVVLRNLIATDHLTALQLLKIAEFKQDQQKIKKYKTLIAEWFHDFLYLRKEVPQKLILSLKKQGLINFQQTFQLLTKETEYQADRKMYVYTGRERKVKKNLYLASLKKQFYLDDMKYEEHCQLFYDPKRVDIFTALFSENIKRVSTKNFISYPKTQIYFIGVTAVILDKVLKGQCQNVKKYVQNIKQLSQKLKRKNQQIIKLFSLKQSIVIPQYQEKKIEVMINNESEGKKPVQRQMSAAERETNRKRTQKMQRIKEKFKKKSNKYSQHEIKRQVVEEEVCLVCREARGKPKQKSFLYYLASVKNYELSQLIFGTESNEQAITSCFHPIHQKCLTYHSRNTCILCKTTGNFLLPVLNENPESQLFLSAWWGDFLSIKSFTPRQNQSYPSYNQQKTPSVDTEIERQHLQELKERPYKNFLIIYRLLAILLSSLFSKGNFEDSLKKITYYYNLIQHFYSRLDQKQRDKVKMEIHSFQLKFDESKVTTYVKDMILVSSKVIQAKLDNLSDVIEAKQKCLQIIEKYPRKWFEDFIQGASFMLMCKFETEHLQKDQKMLSNSEKINRICSVRVPTTMSQLYESRHQCLGCNRMTSWFCIFCQRAGCQNCQSVLNHSKNKHNGSSMIIKNNGNIVNVYKINSSQQFQLYEDAFNCPFNEDQSLHLDHFKYSYSKFSKALETIFKRL